MNRKINIRLNAYFSNENENISLWAIIYAIA